MTKKIFSSILLVSAIVAALGLGLVMGILYQYFGKQISRELEKEAAYLEQGVEQMGAGYLEEIQDPDSRITYIHQDGRVLYDSQADPQEMENHKTREEVREAMEEGSGKAQRISGTLSEKTIYYAQRLENGNILRVSSTQYSVLALLIQLIQPILWILAAMLILSGIFASRIAKKIVEPVNALDLDRPEENQAYEEVAPLLSKIHKQNRQIKEQLDTAQKQQEEFRIITDNMKEGLLVIDRATMILSGNNSAWKLFHTEEAKRGQSVYSLNRSEEFRCVIEKVLEGEHRTAVLKVDGQYVQVIANPVTEQGKAQGAVLLLVNVTEETERENLRREFSANVSHELKTPLTSISGFAEIIQDGFVRPEDVATFAGRIYGEAQRLIHMVEDVIKISQLDEGAVPYEWERVDLYQLCRNIFQGLGEAAHRRQVHLYIEGERVILYTVRTILEEIISNLCDNAIKYNRKDGSVTVVLEETAQEVRIRVKDTGIGIPPEDQARVFERFYRVDKSHSKEIGGTGLGLSIVKHGVIFLKGCVEMESQLGQGTQITVSFPKS